MPSDAGVNPPLIRRTLTRSTLPSAHLTCPLNWLRHGGTGYLVAARRALLGPGWRLPG